MNIGIFRSNLRLFFLTIITLFFLPLLGTISHEYGHIFTAEKLGYKTTLHFASINWEKKINPSNNLVIHQINGSKKGIITDTDLILIGGPLQTIAVGVLGLTIVFLRKKYILKIKQLRFIDWIGVFLSLFWVRNIFNLALYIMLGVIKQRSSYFGGDEAHISQSLGLPIGAIPLFWGIIGITIVSYIIFFVIPKRIRLTFISGGLIGGIAGYACWYYYLGPKLLP